MAPQTQKEYLLKIGFEGFAMVDDIYGRQTRISLPPPPPRTPHAHHHHYQLHYQQESYIYQGTHHQVVTVREPVIDSNQAAQWYGGTVIVDYSKIKPGV
ncbi:hypothetical protein ACOSP7_007263 [Xanthoceras sorbifolium]